MTVYLIKVTLCAFSFYLFYVVFLEREKMHQFKRFYLIFSLMLSIFIPLITFDIPGVHPIMETHNPSTEFFLSDLIFKNEPQLHNRPTGEATNIHNKSINIFSIFSINNIYWVITSILLLRLLRNCLCLLLSAKKGLNIFDNDKKIVLVKNKITPYSFINNIYLNEEDYAIGNIAQEIITHELVHVKQKHSLDILFIEFLIAICWFNPVLYMYRKKIRENHEFLADQAVLENTDNIAGYQNILINMISEKGSIGLASSINYSTIKKRFIMMRKQTSLKKAWGIKMLLVPALFTVFCVFSSQPIAGIEQDSQEINKSIEKSRLNEDNYVIPEKGVTDELLVEYQNIVEKYLAVKLFEKPEWKSMNISNVDRDRLYVIYIQMDKDQRRKQYIHCVGPFNIGKCRRPNKDEWNSANRANILFINGKKAEITDLKAYNRSDIYMFINSYIDEKKEVYQSALWTKDEYESYIEQYKNRIPLDILLEIKPQIWLRTGDLNTALKTK